MRRALELAARGPARGVNPRVGCVILSAHGEVLAEGWHRGRAPRTPRSTRSRSSPPGAARGATAIVTLEPCNHTGRTGPCAQALIEARRRPRRLRGRRPRRPLLGRCAAPARRGRRGRPAACSPTRRRRCSRTGCSARNRPPARTVKWASSLDGRAAAADGTSQWITGPAARADVHRAPRRSRRDRVGTGTVLADDPALTARDPTASSRGAARARRVRPRRVPAGAVLGVTRTADPDVRAPTSRPISRTPAPRHPLALHRGRARRSRARSSQRASPTSARLPRARADRRPADSPSATLGIATIDARSASTSPTSNDSATTCCSSRAARRRAPRPYPREELTCSPESSRSVATSRASSRPPTVRADRARAARRRGRAHGDSIAVSGVCLTVVESDADWFTADVMAQTLAMSTLDDVAAGPPRQPRARRPGGRPSRRAHRAGPRRRHRRTVLEIRPGEAWRVIRFSLDAAHAPLVVDKGSIAVDGVSLTVSASATSRTGRGSRCRSSPRPSPRPRSATASSATA